MFKQMKSKTMELIFGLIISSCVFVKLVQGDSDCSGEHEYRDALGNCQQCEMCGPGYEPGKYHCGYGSKDIDYKCVPCDSGTFSTSTSYNLCVACHPCRTWNRLTAEICTSTGNAECGSCNVGFFRPMKSDGDYDNECHICRDDSTQAECIHTESDWKDVMLIGLAVATALFLFVLVFLCVWYRKRHHESKPTGDVERTSTRFSSRFVRLLSGRCNQDTVTSTSQTPLTSPESQELFPKRSLLNSYQTEKQHAQLGTIVHEIPTYSNQPTALFCESPNEYPDMPTRQFHETARCHAACTVHLPAEPGPLNFGNEFLYNDGSPSNRLDDFHVESFDTASVTKPSTTFEVVPQQENQVEAFQHSNALL
uniref:TNFR-Cys domain-containing protein n=1 Tax=Ciona savignyi TaxID=51511 RepID=H2ZLF4_CIOSA